MTIETLTDEERSRLECVRIALDAKDQRIAELEAEVEIAWENDPLVTELRAEVARLREALAAAEHDIQFNAKLRAQALAEGAESIRLEDALRVSEARVRELEGLDNVQRAVAYLDRAEKAEARVRELEARCEVLRRTSVVSELERQLTAAESEVIRLREALAAAELGEKDAVAALDANWVTHQRVVAAEARARELEAENANLRDAWASMARAHGSAIDQLAAANALLEERAKRCR